jgi:GNAT superfamily N-acetyltransferase
VGEGRTRIRENLLIVEDLFAKNGVDTEINLCPLADPSAFQVLASRGYTVIGLINVYVRVLTDEGLKEGKVKGIVTSRVPAERAQEFPSWSVAGYRDTGKAELLLETLARSAVLRADTSLYIVTVDRKVAELAGMAFVETTKGGVAHFVDNTLPEYRGRGIQATLLRARLADARKQGLILLRLRPGPVLRIPPLGCESPQLKTEPGPNTTAESKTSSQGH